MNSRASKISKLFQDHTEKKNGFTLLETLVAIFILITGIIGPLTLASSSINSATASKNRIIALNLAQGGADFVRNKRDSNFLAGDDWLKNLGPCQSANGCQVDFFSKIPPNDKDVKGCSSNCDPLRQNINTKILSYDPDPVNTVESIFTRIVFINDVANSDYDGDGDDDEISVVVRVSWEERFASQNFEIETRLFRWRL